MKVLIILLILISTFCIVLELNSPEKHKDIISYEDYGTVSNISNCHVVKYGYLCYVTTSKGFYKEFDFNRFDGDSISVGDEIYLKIVNDGLVKEKFLCKNDECKSYSSCEWWMSCF